MNDKNRIRGLVQNQKTAEAKSLCIEVCEANPDDAEAWFLHGMLDGLMENFSSADGCYDNVIKLIPDMTAAYYNKGIALQSIKKYDQALAAFNKVLELDPGFENIELMLSDVLSVLGDSQAALFHCQTFLDKNPDHIHATCKFGTLLFGKNDYVEAEVCFKKVISLQPDYAEAIYSLGSLLKLQGKLKESEELYKKLIELRPGYHLAHNNLGIIYQEKSEFKQAAEYFEKAVDYKSDYVDGYINLGHAYQMLERYADAAKAYHKAIELNPENPETHYSLGLQYEELGEYSTAKKHFSRASLINTDDIRYLYVLARVVTLEKKYDEAISYYKSIIKKNDSFVDAYISMGKVSLESGDRALAIESFKQAVAKRPDHVTANYYLAELDPTDETTNSQNQYIKVLFDEYADSFEKDLIEKLDYKTPEVIHREVEKYLSSDEKRVIFDLGCGTGLCGKLFRAYSSRLVGIDLSSKIIEKARSKSIYDELYVDEITVVLNKEVNNVDLVLAADVFVYIGDLQMVFESVCQALKFNALFSFSVERKSGESYELQGNGRYSHSVEYIKHLANSTRLQVLSHTPSVLRKELGVEVQGDVYILQKL